MILTLSVKRMHIPRFSRSPFIFLNPYIICIHPIDQYLMLDNWYCCKSSRLKIVKTITSACCILRDSIIFLGHFSVKFKSFNTCIGPQNHNFDWHYYYKSTKKIAFINPLQNYIIYMTSKCISNKQHKIISFDLEIIV